jgi:DNA-directed RNA polymerase subunit beta'
MKKEIIKTTIGRVIFNKIVPEKLQFINEVLGKGKIKNLIKDCLDIYGEETTVKFIDDLKNLAFSL